MPKLFQIGEYIIFFWSNENGEPIHVHIAKGKPSASATKIWLTQSGGCVLANNNSRILNQDLNELMDVISAQFFLICRKWKEHFVLILYPFTVNQKSTAHFLAADLLLAGWMEQNLDGTIK